ncbi:winged helix-turn-helix domain-containing protein [Paenibacillus dendritiformis]|uniref:winged helix-turn-helix domain-containing protein n=1 Tax=Paenibacillus dendritiformis TaxID=130049 RepID=UPI0015EBD99C
MHNYLAALSRQKIEKIKISNQLSYYFLGEYIVKNNKRIYLTPTENKLLQFFISNPNARILPYQLINHLDSTSSLTEQNIYVYIYRLRMKLEINPSAPEILINIRPGYIFLCNNY